VTDPGPPDPAREPATPAARDPGDRTAPRRLEGDFQRVHPLSPLMRVGVLLMVAVLATWRQMLEEFEPLAALTMLVAFVVVGGTYGVLSWWFTRFRIDAEELRVDSGVLLRRSRRIRIERLQGVDVVQPLLARLFGMAELRFEVAGGSGTEAPLAYLPLAEAHRLRGVLLQRARHSAQAGPADASSTTEPPTPATEPSAFRGPSGHPPPAGRSVPAAGPPVADERVFARVDPTWLVVGTLLSGEFIGSVLLAVVALVASSVSGEAAGLALFVPAVVGAGSVLVRGIVRQWGFVLSDTAQGWRLRSGLFDLRSQTVPLDRVQGIAVLEPLLWRPLGWVKVQVDVAGYYGSSAASGGPSASTLLPVAPRPLASAVLTRLLEGGTGADVPLVGAPAPARLLRPVGWRRLGVGTDGDLVVTTRGWVKRRTDIVPHRKIQSLRVQQGPVQRRLGLFTVVFQTTPGPVDAVGLHRPLAEIREWTSEEMERAAQARARSATRK
jgi:putative membrane protein